MSNLLPVGTRVKIVGPDCNGSNWLVGQSFSIVAISNTPHPICIGHKFGCVWFPETSIQEIKEQTVKIENETQYQKGLAYVKAKEEFHEVMGNDKAELSSLRAAIAAYESRDKVKKIAEGLCETDKNILLVMTQESAGSKLYYVNSLSNSLDYKDSTEKLQSYATPLAHEVAAYLRSQKREMKWEVWYKGREDFHYPKEWERAVCRTNEVIRTDNRAEAYQRAVEFMSEYSTYICEVREVK